MIAASATQFSGTMVLSPWDYAAIGLFLAILSLIGYFAGHKERASSEEYFLAGKRLPWYIVGSSFVAANISTEHFIGMVGSACIYGICLAMYEWANVFTFSFLIWLFIPFLLASRVFTIPEFLEPATGAAYGKSSRSSRLSPTSWSSWPHRSMAAAWSYTTSSAGRFGTPSSAWAWCPAYGPSTVGCRRSPGPIPS